MCSLPSSPVQDQITVPIYVVIRSFSPIVDITLKIMVYILSVNMYSYEHMWAFPELSTMTDDRSESNPTCSDYSTLEYIMWDIPSFGIVQKNRVYFWCGLWEYYSFPSNWACLNLEFLSWLWVFVLKSQFLAPLPNWPWIWLACRVYVKKTPNIRMISEANKRWVQNISGGFFT